ncbi:MAG TPA: hypothetical protein VGG74_26830 [Kofleriaceae bacterium]
MAVAKHLPAAIVVAIAAFIVWAFAATVLVRTRHMVLPLDDSYIYLTYAKQFGRAHPFTYFSGGGYSAGSTSVLWPMLLAPFWMLGARGHALVWVSYGMCALLFAGVGLGIYKIVRRVAGCGPVGAACAVMALAIGPFAFGALSGMEVAFAAALLVLVVWLLLDRDASAPPDWKLAAALAATSLSRPEATLVVGGVVMFGAIATWRARGLRPAARWLVALVPALLWLTANKLFAGHWFPNTGVVKSQFYLPGFDWASWRTTTIAQLKATFRALFWEPGSPLVHPRLVTLVLVAGAARAIVWAVRANKPLVAIVAIGAPIALIAGVVATSGVGNGVTITAYNFQNYRYVATALPLLFVLAGFALAPFVTRKLPFAIAASCVAAAFLYTAWPELRENMRLFAQGAVDTNAQVVTLGHYIHDKLPGARVMLHDAGAIAYYGDGPVYDMLGLVTNDQAEVANNGPGSRFEFLEHMPPGERPAYFAYYPSWLGSMDFFGAALVHTPLGPGFTTKPRLVGDGDMELLPAVWDHIGTGEAPLADHAGWAVVDTVDVADLASERAHHWTATLGHRRLGDPTARWSFVEREVMPSGLVIDGGRTIRADGAPAGESFELDVDPDKPVRLVLRTGGAPDVTYQDHVGRTTLDIDGATVDVPAPIGRFVELAIDLPKGTHRVTVRSAHSYRAFHWFALQGDGLH